MKNSENTALLARKRAFDARRRDAAIARRKVITDTAIAKIRGAK